MMFMSEVVEKKDDKGNQMMVRMDDDDLKKFLALKKKFDDPYGTPISNAEVFRRLIRIVYEKEYRPE